MRLTYCGQTSAHGLVLERRLREIERVVLGLCWDRRGGGEVVRIPSVTATVAFVIVSVMKTLLGWLGRERQGRDIRRGRGAGHDLMRLTGE